MPGSGSGLETNELMFNFGLTYIRFRPIFMGIVLV